MLGAGLVALVRPFVVAAGGAVPIDTVLAELTSHVDAAPLGAERLAELFDEAVRERHCPLRLRADGTVVDVAELGRRLALTHRLTAAEVASSTLDLSPDLGMVSAVACLDGGLHLPDGTPLRLRERRERGAGREGSTRLTMHLEGPAGWLDGFRDGGLLMARTAGGVVTLDPVADEDLVPAPPDLAAGFGAVYDQANEGDGSPVWDEEMQLGAAAGRLGWFDHPTLPMRELVAAAGFEVDGNSVGRPGCWEEYHRVGEVVGALVRNGDLEEADLSLLLDLLKVFATWRDDPATVLPRATEARLRRRWPVAQALVDEVRRREADAAALDGFGTAVGGATGTWMRARAAAIDGRTGEAEVLAGEALDADPGFGPAVAEAAWYASDRGEARQAINLLHRVRHHDDSQLAALRQFAGLLAPTIGRNERCPCGSGRKYKQCHLGRLELPEAGRVRWLLDKARFYVDGVAPPEVLDDEIGRADDGHGGDVVGMDLLLFDQGWLARFAAARGSLLPEVERDWLARWSAAAVTSLFRTVAVTDAGGAVLEDLVTGERRTVEPSPSVAVAVADCLVWCRLLPVGPRWWTSGVARAVALSERETLLAALAPEAHPGARRDAILPEPGQPRLRNTSGDPLLLVTLRVGVDGALDAAAALDARLGRDGDEPRWHTSEDTPSMEAAVTASFLLDDDTGDVVVEVNSLRRRDAAVALLGELLPGAVVIDEQRVPIARAQSAEADRLSADTVVQVLGPQDPTADGPGPDDDEYDEYYDDDEDDDYEDEDEDEDEDDAGLRAVEDAFRAEMEARWLDRPIAVLGGRTPREAAADEASRPDLRTLVAELEVSEGTTLVAYREVLGLPLAEPRPAR